MNSLTSSVPLVLPDHQAMVKGASTAQGYMTALFTIVTVHSVQESEEGNHMIVQLPQTAEADTVETGKRKQQEKHKEKPQKAQPSSAAPELPFYQLLGWSLYGEIQRDSTAPDQRGDATRASFKCLPSQNSD